MARYNATDAVLDAGSQCKPCPGHGHPMPGMSTPACSGHGVCLSLELQPEATRCRCELGWGGANCSMVSSCTPACNSGSSCVQSLNATSAGGRWICVSNDSKRRSTLEPAGIVSAALGVLAILSVLLFLIKARQKCTREYRAYRKVKSSTADSYTGADSKAGSGGQRAPAASRGKSLTVGGLPSPVRRAQAGRGGGCGGGDTPGT